MSLYTKYRSQTFDDLVEQDSIKKILKNQVLKINSGETKLSNYIFFGPRGTGKTSIARIFAKAINCTNNNDGNPCNVCEACIAINTNKTLDVLEIDAASHTGVDNIREEILAKAIYPPSNLRKKIYIIDEAHMLSKSAFNALLKIIEEPPEYLVFILATTDPQKILDTVKSRCQLFGFKNISMDGIVGRLKYVCEKENIIYDDQGLFLIAKIANGGLRDALKYLDQVSGIGDATADIVAKTLGITNDSVIQDFINIYHSGSLSEIYEMVDSISSSGNDIASFLKDLAQYLDKNMSVSDMSDNISIVNIIAGYFDNIRNYPYPTTVLKYQILLNKNAGSEVKSTKSKDKVISDVVIENNKKEDKVIVSKNIVENPSELEQKTETTINDTEKENPIIPDTNDIDLGYIKQYIIDNSGNTIKGIRAKSCDILSIQDGIMEVAVISQGSINILEMKKADVEKLLKELLGKNLSITYKVINSEDLLQNIFDNNNNMFV